VNFDYSDDQKALKAEARRFLAARCPISTVRGVLDDTEASFDRTLWRAVVDMGWTGAAIPERWGGTGLGYVELCGLAEELGRVLAPLPFASTVYAFTEAILRFGSDAQRDSLLPGVAAGAVIGCLATGEGKGPTAQAVPAARVSGGRLSGVKVPVADGDVATHALVSAQDARGGGLFVVDLSDDGVERRALRSLDPTRSVASLHFDAIPCERLEFGAQGGTALSDLLDRVAVLLAFEQLGGADRCLEAAQAYALTRYAFGRPIGAHQAVKHKLADIYVKNELARSHAYHGAWALSADNAVLPRAAAAARVSGSLAFDFAAKESLHIHGGVGFTWEADCHLYLRRARHLGLVLGGLPVWRERLVLALERDAA